MIDSELLDQLVQLVMSERQAKVYMAMLTNGNSSAAELQRKAGIPQSKIYDTLDFLVNQGYCIKRQSGKKRTYESVDPTVAIKQNISRLESRIKKLNELAKQLAMLYAKSGKTKEPFEYIEIIHGNENAHTKYVELLRNVKFEALNFTRPPFASVTQEMYEEQMVLLQRFLDGGGKVRGVFEVNEHSPPRMFDVSYRSHQLGEKFRIAQKLPLKMYIFDRENLLIADRSSLASEDEISMTVIKQKTTVDGYVALFEFFWEQSEEYEKWIVGKEELMKQKLAEQ